MRTATHLLFVLSLLHCVTGCEVSAGDPIDGSLLDDDDAGTGGDGDGGGSGRDAAVDAGGDGDDAGAVDGGADAGGSGGPALEDCLGPQLLADRLAGRDCGVLYEKTLAEGPMQYLADAVSAGRVAYDASLVKGCLDAIAALGCEAETTRWPAACQLAVAGTVAEGGDCALDEDCAGKAFCEKGPAQCPGSCSALLAAGATCSDDRECDDGLVCFESKCAALGVAGDACGTGLPACKAGFDCRPDGGANKCKAIGAVRIKQLNEACDINGDLCVAGLVCASTGVGTAGVCEEQADSGGACKRSVPNQCPVFQYCGTDVPGVVDVCLERPRNGEPCLNRRQACADGHVCVTEGASDVCRPINDAGEACTTDPQCYSGLCGSSDRCEAPLTCDVPG
jgi:hypothetical protein